MTRKTSIREIPVTISAFSMGMLAMPMKRERQRFFILFMAMQAQRPMRVAMRAERKAMTIVFQCSDMASYLSGDLMVVDYGSSLEVEAGIRPNAMAFTFDMILEKMAAMHK